MVLLCHYLLHYMKKISLVGPGIMEIPPKGWGAVEILIWDYKEALEKEGFEVQIVNTQDQQQIVDDVNSFNPDFVHIQYDNYCHLENKFICKNVALTTHYGYVEQLQHRQGDGYVTIFNNFLNSKIAKLFCLSPSIAKIYTDAGFPKNRVYVTPNGVRDDLFKYMEVPERPDLSIYLAKIDYRKRQHLFHNIPGLMFAGNIADPRFVSNNNYLGEVTKQYLYKHLTKFSNLVLLSDGEAHPLVCIEALCVGLGLVISEYATANLDLSKPFITVIPESKINDKEYVEGRITANKNISLTMRNEIRKYAIENFAYSNIVKNYINCAIK